MLVVFEPLDSERTLVKFPYMRDSAEGGSGSPRGEEVFVPRTHEPFMLHTQSNSSGNAGTTSPEEIDQLIDRFLPTDE